MKRSKSGRQTHSVQSFQSGVEGIVNSGDYRTRSYLSAGEVSDMLGIGLNVIYRSVRNGTLRSTRSASGQHRFSIRDVEAFDTSALRRSASTPNSGMGRHQKSYSLEVNGTLQRVIASSSQSMSELGDGSVNLAITSPPYFDTKMYSGEGQIEGDMHIWGSSSPTHGVSIWLDFS